MIIHKAMLVFELDQRRTITKTPVRTQGSQLRANHLANHIHLEAAVQIHDLTKQVVQDKFKKDYIATYGLKGLESGGHISQAEYLE